MYLLHSLTLLAALVIGTVGTGAAATVWMQALRNKDASARFVRISLRCGILTVLFGVLSAWVHLRFGHGLQTPEPMTPQDFLLHHTAYWFVVMLAAASFTGQMVSARSTR